MRHAISLAILTSVALLPFGAGAQQTAQQTADDKVLAELIVTASKREQTSAGRAVLGGGDRPKHRSATRGTNNIVELARNVAGLTITDLGAGPEPGRDPRHQLRPGGARSSRA